MKTNLICWLPECCYRTDVDYAAEIILCLADNNIAPLLDSEYAESIWEQLDQPPTLRELFYQADTPTYKDEPFSVIDGEDSKEWVKQTVAKYPNVIMGESSTEDIERLVECGVKNITYTSYGLHLFRLFGINFRLDFISQVYTWDRIMKKYPDKFHHNWIMLDKPNRFRHLIEWCVRNGNTIMLAVPDKRKKDTEWIYQQLTKFVNIYKEIVE